MMSNFKSTLLDKTADFSPSVAERNLRLRRIIYTFPFVSCELWVYRDLCKLVRCVCGWYNQNSARMKYRWQLRWLKVHVMEGGGRAGGLSLSPHPAAVVQVKV